MTGNLKRWSLSIVNTKLLVFFAALFISFSAVSEDWLYTVRGKDTAASIGKKYLINPYRIDAILKYNQVQADGLKPGMVLKFPLSSLKFGPARVQVVALEGSVTFRRNGATSPLDSLISLQLNDAILTGAQSSVTLKFADNSELLLGSNSELIFDVLTKWGRTGMVDTKMRLMKGNIEGRVNKLEGPGSHFEVHTPTAVATVRGTEFRVRVSENNTNVSYNEVSEGKVLVENNVSDKMIPMGFGLVSEAGKVADKPVELLAPPQLINPLKQYPALPVSLDWERDEAAENGYRLEIFKGSDFSKQVRSLMVAKPNVALDQLPAGEYTLRLRAIDSNGLEGLNRVHRFALNGAPVAPVNLRAENNLTFGALPSFRWSSVDSAQSYELQVSRDKDFSNVIDKTVITESSYKALRQLPSGKYFWRVASSNQFGQGYFSDAETFTIAGPKKIIINSIDDVQLGTSVEVTWNPVPSADGYYWQLSTDSDFETVLDEGAVSQPVMAFDSLEDGSYYVRVKAQSSQNQQNKDEYGYSNSQNFDVYEEGNGKEPFMLGSLLLILLLL